MNEAQQAAQDAIHDLVNDSLASIQRIRYADMSSQEKDKLAREVSGNLIEIDTLRRRC